MSDVGKVSECAKLLDCVVSRGQFIHDWLVRIKLSKARSSDLAQALFSSGNSLAALHSCLKTRVLQIYDMD